MNGFKAPAFRRLTRADLPTFDQEAKDLILKAMGIGCVGRISSKGHCILHSNTGGTTSIPPNLTSQNRTAQNARAGIRRLMAEHRTAAPLPGSAPEPRPVQKITVAEAFLQHSKAFTAWFDAREGSLPAEALLRVTFDASDQPQFEVISTPEIELEPAPQPGEFRCEICQRLCGTAAGLGSHRRVHRDQTASTPRAGHGSDIDQTTPQKATHDMPAPTHQTAPTDTAGRVEDPVAVLHRVREALGPDPRVTQLEARVAELQTEVTQQKQRADEASARLALIQEAFHA
ncbi:hypothetical protein [Streptomyces brevispora]|uniref:hypothetical protein n=1 Tax=Streptomyces brevispora TaxID=887462 RepID=UPI00382A4C3D